MCLKRHATYFYYITRYEFMGLLTLYIVKLFVDF